MSLKAISFNTIGVRASAVIVCSAVVLLAIFTVVWCLANTASFVAEEKEVNVLITELSPSDPQTHFASAIRHEQTFEPADLSTSLTEYEKAAALSPYNYQHWLRLGSARGRAGETASAEAAFRRALALAPNYSRVHWALGNFLLRDGADDEAYSELRKAIESDPAVARPAVTIALQMADGDAEIVQSRFQDLPNANAALAVLLAGQKRWDEAAKVWNSVPMTAGDKSISEATQAMKRAFFEGR